MKKSEKKAELLFSIKMKWAYTIDFVRLQFTVVFDNFKINALIKSTYTHERVWNIRFIVSFESMASNNRNEYNVSLECFFFFWVFLFYFAGFCFFFLARIQHWTTNDQSKRMENTIKKRFKKNKKEIMLCASDCIAHIIRYIDCCYCLNAMCYVAVCIFFHLLFFFLKPFSMQLHSFELQFVCCNGNIYCLTGFRILRVSFSD